jgi:LuxR family transcriptional regulator, maltose regulon positive regulatory protein
MSAQLAFEAPDREITEDFGLLASKITVPGLPGWLVSRRRLDELLTDGARRPLTVVTGPPGAGKTVAISSWAEAGSSPGPLAWMSVDRYDNQPAAFWRHVVEALSRAGLAVPRTAPACAHPGSANRSFLSGLASALAARDVPVVLALDDIHLLTKPEPLNDLVYLVRHAAARLRLVVSSRRLEPLPLHRFRLAGDLAEIRARDLAFTIQETAALMERHDLRLSRSALTALTSRTEGWAAGLRLAAIAMQGQADPGRLAAGFGAEDSALFGYLMNEAFDNQPARIQDLLLKTSILDRVSGDLAAELTDDPDAACSLPGLAESNAFVQPLGRGWYRYHSLYAHVLRLKLRREFRRDVPELHRRAARWLRRSGRVDAAVSRAAAAADRPPTARTGTDELGAGRPIEAQAPSRAATAALPVITETLSRREREVLELVSGMLTTAEIADELYLSANTVKSHVRSILRKLGAARRGEAVRRARQLQLLLAARVIRS